MGDTESNSGQANSTFSITCPNCGSGEFTDSHDRYLCSYCGSSFQISEIVSGATGEHETLLKEYFNTKSNLKEAKNQLNKFDDEALEKEATSLKRNKFLEINDAQESKKMGGFIFTLLFSIIVIGGLCSLAYSADWSIAVFIILVILVFAFRERLWKGTRDFFMRKELNEIESRYQREIEQLKKDHKTRKADLAQEVEKLEVELENHERKLST